MSVIAKQSIGSHSPDRKDASTGNENRVEWFDYAKGICIILVVMLHSTRGVGDAFGVNGLAPEGFMHSIVAYAKPFRMPDFFMLAGLFLSYAINRGWMHYLDKKVVHFAYFYVLWTVILATAKMTAKVGFEPIGLLETFVSALVNPYVTLWFIYVLPIFFVVTKLLKPILRTIPTWALLVAATALQMLPVHTGWSAIDRFAGHYYVFFLGGYLLAPYIFKVATLAIENIRLALALLAGWAVLNGVLAFSQSPISGWTTIAELPIISTALGGMGGMAIVAIAALFSKFNVMPFVRYCGANSIVLYISFTIPMAFTRVILLKTGMIANTGIASMVVWLVAITLPLVFHLVLSRTPLKMLYERPAWAKLPYKVSQHENALSVRHLEH